MAVLMLIAFGTALKISVHLNEIFVYDASVDYKVCNNGKFAQRLKHKLLSLDLVCKGSAGKCGYTVDYHCTSAADRLHTAALPPYPFGRIAVYIEEIVGIIERIENRRNGNVPRPVI
jgi:hypothetical protein